MSDQLCRLSVHLTGGPMWRHTPKAFEIVRRARKLGMAGASVFEGADLPLEERVLTSMLRVVRRHPLTVVVVDREEKVRQLVRDLSRTLDDTVATLELVERIPTGH
ncbi:DUF190 domain-containing protein [Streptomyces sp. NPDC048258]|uniref:DUF190 domain-containing protein n=1 Tax=Streptomyces sp. NPDC048258 TaxID=3365527 RepID=UPI00371C7030